MSYFLYLVIISQRTFWLLLTLPFVNDVTVNIICGNKRVAFNKLLCVHMCMCRCSHVLYACGYGYVGLRTTSGVIFQVLFYYLFEAQSLIDLELTK